MGPNTPSLEALLQGPPKVVMRRRAATTPTQSSLLFWHACCAHPTSGPELASHADLVHPPGRRAAERHPSIAPYRGSATAAALAPRSVGRGFTGSRRARGSASPVRYSHGQFAHRDPTPSRMTLPPGRSSTAVSVGRPRTTPRAFFSLAIPPAALCPRQPALRACDVPTLSPRKRARQACQRVLEQAHGARIGPALQSTRPHTSNTTIAMDCVATS